ncbi:Metalloenzyme, LuxS/M16 peptidase-like protein [Hysterangium stoloniferum]|nr:Metalloenzyme, LuxS/M16 peptidase-like protein [Hysterangium stoloniferum]
MYTSLVNDVLAKYAYDASLAGLDYVFSNYDRGVHFSVSRYNEKLPELVKKVLETMKNKKLNPARFKVLMEDLKQRYENFYLMQPYQITDYWLGYLLSDLAWTPKECLAEMDTLTVEEVEAHRDQLLHGVYIEGLSHGNEATSLLDLYEKLLGSHPVTLSEKLTERSLILPKGIVLLTVSTLHTFIGSNFVYKLDVPNPKVQAYPELAKPSG